MDGKSTSQDALADAERWYARLMAPDCTAFERRQFERWRAAPAHAAAFEATEKLWQSLGRLAGRPDLEQLSREVLTATAGPPGKRWSVLLSAASVLLLLLGGAAWLALESGETKAAVYVAGRSERITIGLMDSSQLVLNSGTELEARYGNDIRRITVRKGEALFAVAQDARRPFKVVVGDSEVTALGTRFQVRREGERVTVTLLEGRVVVDRGQLGEHIELEPGDQARFTVSEPQIARRLVDPQVVASWSTGRLRFRATPLAEVIEEVNRYSEAQLRITDPALARTPISGSFEVGDSGSVVAALEALLPVHAARESGRDGSDVTLIAPR